MKTSICILVTTLSFGTTVAMAQSNAIKIEKPWTRATAPGAAVGGGFATIRNTGKTADRLLSASSPVSASMEMHQMAMVNDVMKMREVKALELPANSVIELKPGAYHLMFIGLKAPLKQGERVPVTLKFEKAGEVKVALSVESLGASASASAGAAHNHGDMNKH